MNPTTSTPTLTIEPVVSYTVELPGHSILGTIEESHGYHIFYLATSDDNECSWWSKAFPTLRDAELFLERNARILADCFHAATSRYLRDVFRSTLDELR